MVSNYSHLILSSIILFTMTLGNCTASDDDVAKAYLETDVPNQGTIKKQVRETTFQIPDEKWTTTALVEIAYFLRNHKYNEWDRRYYEKKPDNILVGFNKAFPKPSLRTHHWKVYENCNKNFYKCITYLHSVIVTSPFTRDDDITILLNEKPLSINGSLLKKTDNECQRILQNMENTGLPFDDPMEKFQWRTTASYFMCWYTMLGIPALSMLGESCDNFANCLDPVLGPRNHDPRADNRLSFSCALYSFCPDPCCDLKHITNKKQCYENENNPCFVENRDTNNKVCTIDRKENVNYNDITANKWNITCNCEMKGFVWKSQFKMCVDINECVTGEHNCNIDTEDCLNLPGTYQCICKWEFVFNHETKKCVKAEILHKSDSVTENKNLAKDSFMSILGYFGM